MASNQLTDAFMAGFSQHRAFLNQKALQEQQMAHERLMQEDQFDFQQGLADRQTSQRLARQTQLDNQRNTEKLRDDLNTLMEHRIDLYDKSTTHALTDKELEGVQAINIRTADRQDRELVLKEELQDHTMDLADRTHDLAVRTQQDKVGLETMGYGIQHMEAQGTVAKQMSEVRNEDIERTTMMIDKADQIRSNIGSTRGVANSLKSTLVSAFNQPTVGDLGRLDGDQLTSAFNLDSIEEVLNGTPALELWKTNDSFRQTVMQKLKLVSANTEKLVLGNLPMPGQFDEDGRQMMYEPGSKEFWMEFEKLHHENAQAVNDINGWVGEGSRVGEAILGVVSATSRNVFNMGEAVFNAPEGAPYRRYIRPYLYGELNEQEIIDNNANRILRSTMGEGINQGMGPYGSPLIEEGLNMLGPGWPGGPGTGNANFGGTNTGGVTGKGEIIGDGGVTGSGGSTSGGPGFGESTSDGPTLQGYVADDVPFWGPVPEGSKHAPRIRRSKYGPPGPHWVPGVPRMMPDSTWTITYPPVSKLAGPDKRKKPTQEEIEGWIGKLDGLESRSGY